MAFLRTEAPIFDGREKTAERVARLADYLTQHARELDFVLTHLNGENMNGTLLSLGVSDGAGNSVGTMGVTGSGVGLMSGGCGIRVTASGVEITDGGDWVDIRSLVTLDGTPTEGSENGVTSGGVYDAVERMKPVTLWENPDLLSSFAAQTVSIPLLIEYDWVYIEIAATTLATAVRGALWIMNGRGKTVSPMIFSPAAVNMRECILQTDGIYFGEGVNKAETTNTGGMYAVPVRVLGVKY